MVGVRFVPKLLSITFYISIKKKSHDIKRINISERKVRR